MGRSDQSDIQRQRVFYRSILFISLLIAVQTIVGVFGAYELSKGAQFHQFNHLHISYDLKFRNHLDAAQPPLTPDTLNLLEQDVQNIKDQPLACLRTAAWYDRLFLQLIGTAEAIELCKYDIEIANRALSALSYAKTNEQSHYQLLALLYWAASKFHDTSEQFELLVKKTVNSMYIAVLVVLLSSGLLALALGGSLLVSLTRCFREAEDLRITANSANNTKSQFLANMSHEIRTPLNGIIGNLELAEDIISSEEAAEYVAIAARSADNLLCIINDILDIAKIEAGKLTVESIEFNVSNLVDDVTLLYQAHAVQKGVTLTTKCTLTHPVRMGDPTRIRQILTNLVNNAIKFTGNGGTVTIEAKELPETINFIVSDTGIGIPPEKQRSVFLSFEQADVTTTRKYGGTGLGLTIVSRLVSLMHGEIKLQSEIGKGSQFSVKIPLTKQLYSAPDCDDTTADLIDNGKLHILVVDDILTNLFVVRKLLERMGHSVVTASNGQEAIQIYSTSQEPFHVVLMDIQMPILDGVEATTKLKSQYGSSLAPIIALTAHAMSTDREKYLSAGMDGYLTKPIRSAALRTCLIQALQAKSTHIKQ